MIFEIDGIDIEILPKRIKSINLRVYPPDGVVKMSVPIYYNETLIRACLQDKMPWINKQRQRILQTSYSKAPLFQTGSTLEFKGNSYLLLIEEHHGPSQIRIKDQLIQCFTQPKNASSEQVQVLIESWYKREMESLIPELITRWQSIIGVKVNQWGIKKMKTRWGSCNPRASRIWLNLNLIKKPMPCLEYVLVHELVHLLEPSHNKRFYTLMMKFMPKWREYHLILEGKAFIPIS